MIQLSTMLCFKTIIFISIYLTGKSYGQGTPADKCTRQVNNCACETATGWVNLEPLDQAKINGQPKFQGISDGTDTYSYNPCTPYNDNTCTSVAGCQYHTSGFSYYAIGLQDTAKFQDDADNGPVILYSATGSDFITRKMEVILMCDSTVEGTLLANGESQTTDGEFLFTLTTKYACSDIAPPASGGSSGGGGGGLSGGSILLIIVFVLLVVYLVGGVLFNRFYRGATGIEMVPNLDFWKALPGLIKDGGQFAWAKITGKSSKSSTYDSI